MKFWKVGSLNPKKGQRDRWGSHAPKKRGLWAQPFGWWYEGIISRHYYRWKIQDRYLQPNLSVADQVFVELQDSCIFERGRFRDRRRIFEYDGVLWTHLDPRGSCEGMVETADAQVWWEDPPWWDQVETHEFERRLRRFYAKMRARHQVRVREALPNWSFSATVGAAGFATEVFIERL